MTTPPRKKPKTHKLSPDFTLTIEEDGANSNKLTLCGPLSPALFGQAQKVLENYVMAHPIGCIRGDKSTIEFAEVPKKLTDLARAAITKWLNRESILSKRKTRSALDCLSLPPQDKHLDEIKHRRIHQAHKQLAERDGPG